jgi:Flp pilus assembly protein TadG
MIGMSRKRSGTSERGNATLSVIVIVPAFVLVIGLVVDGAGKFQSADEARWLAQQAARVATQQVDTDAIADGNSPGVNIAAAMTAAENYLALSGVSGSVTQTPDGVRVSVTTVYHTRIMPLVGMTELSSTATVTARIVRGVDSGGP